MEAQILAHQVIEDIVDNYQTDVELFMWIIHYHSEKADCLAAKIRHCNLQTFKCW